MPPLTPHRPVRAVALGLPLGLALACGPARAPAPVQAGRVQLGCGAGLCPEDELPVHAVRLTQDLLVDRTEVIAAEWQQRTGRPAGRCGPDCPAVDLSWFDAVAFANARSAADGLPACYELGPVDARGEREVRWPEGPGCAGWRLPTEAEWEAAAQAGGHRYAGGDDVDAVAWHVGNSGGRLRPAAGKAAGPTGLHDLGGSVWEWCWDWYARDAYARRGPEDVDPIGPPDGLERVARGGSWANEPGDARASGRRNRYPPGLRGPRLGVRLVRAVR